MHTYLILFKVKNTTTAEKLIQAIKAYGTYSNIIENAWLVVTDKTAVNIRDELTKFLNSGDNDRIVVIRSGREAAWKNVISSNKWLMDNL